MQKTAYERFEDNVCPEPNTGCWLWCAGVNGADYGQIWYVGRLWFAHRLAWVLFVGQIPRGLWVLHRCDTPSCVNPSHLFLGTRADNIADATAKGRLNKGINNHFAKIDPHIAEEVRWALSEGFTQREIGRSFGIAQTTVSCIKRGQTWRS